VLSAGYRRPPEFNIRQRSMTKAFRRDREVFDAQLTRWVGPADLQNGWHPRQDLNLRPTA
jgi:hypothetical protein